MPLTVSAPLGLMMLSRWMISPVMASCRCPCINKLMQCKSQCILYVQVSLKENRSLPSLSDYAVPLTLTASSPAPSCSAFTHSTLWTACHSVLHTLTTTVIPRSAKQVVAGGEFSIFNHWIRQIGQNRFMSWPKDAPTTDYRSADMGEKCQAHSSMYSTLVQSSWRSRALTSQTLI